MSSPIMCSICRNSEYDIPTAAQIINYDENDELNMRCKFTTACNHCFHQGCWNRLFKSKARITRLHGNYNTWYALPCPNCRQKCFKDGSNIKDDEYIEYLIGNMSEFSKKLEDYMIIIGNMEIEARKNQNEIQNMKTNYNRMTEYITLSVINKMDDDDVNRGLHDVNRGTHDVNRYDDLMIHGTSMPHGGVSSTSHGISSTLH